MTRDQALKKLRTLLGPRAFWEIRKHAPDKDEREENREILRRLATERERLDEAMRVRMRELFNADPAYVALEAQRTQVREQIKRHSERAFAYRFTIGTVSTGPLQIGHIEGQGDTWEECFADCEQKRARR